MIDYSKRLKAVITNLSQEDSLRGLFHQHLEGNPLPDAKAIRQIVELSRSIFFPGYFGSSKVNRHTILFHIGVQVEKLFELLSEQIAAALCFKSADTKDNSRDTVSSERADLELSSIHGAKEQGKQCMMCNDEVKDLAASLASKYIDKLDELRALIALDVKIAFENDPAATSFGEVICCYPGIRAICNYRIAHALLELGVPLIPRAITELAHSETGIDIHPGARIGKSFAIDHGTGVVIGETCIIGDNVQLYQGVTLGAKNIPVDENGVPLNVPRHPILEDHVVVYSNATILGRITIGSHAVIGGNVWVTEDVPAYGKVVQPRPPKA